MCPDTGVCLIYYDQGRARSRKTVATPLCLDVVEADNCEGMRIKQSLRCGQTALQARRGRSGDSYSIEIEFSLKFAGPLLDKMWWAQDREAIRFATVDQFTQDESGFNRFAYADVVSDQQSHDWKAQRHQEWHKLVGTRFEGDASR